MNTDICVIGAGPAGLMAAIHAGMNGAAALVVEGNTVAGRKLLLTGGGRCNFTHAGAPEELARAFGRQGRFLRHSLYEFSPEDVREFFSTRGLASTVEADGGVFPAGNRAADVRDILVDEVVRHGVRFLYGSRVTGIAAEDDRFGVRTESRAISALRVIIATGGLSWPQTGSTGDGYHFASQLGHTVIRPRPALVPLIAEEAWVGELAGVSLANVKIRSTVRGRKVSTAGNMLFTQGGIGGPAVQDMSRFLTDEWPGTDRSIEVAIDLIPEKDGSQIDRQLQQSFQAHSRRTVANALSELMPRQLSLALCHLAGCDPDLQAGQLPAEQRRKLSGMMKRLPLHITGTEPIEKATVTRGGVSRDEIDPHTLESRIHPGLFFAGEVMDLDGPCGGYNLQMCWSTGAVAGRAAARSVRDANPHSA